MMRNVSHKKALVLGIIVLFIGLSITSSIGTRVVKKPNVPLSNGKTLYVGGSGPDNYTKIQDAIDNASQKDTVFVYNGTYYENVIINKYSLSLIGENKETTILDGGGINDVILIDGEDNDFVTISGFTIQNGGNDAGDDAGIDIYTAGNTITGNIIRNNGGYGIFCIGVYYYEGYNNIYDNFIIKNEFGIFLDRCFYNEIYDNYIADNEQAGIYVGSTVFPTLNLEEILFFEFYNDLYKNTITNNGEGIEIELSFTNVFKNNISNNNYGISVVSFINCRTNYNNIYQNNINNNSYGIFVYSELGELVENNISNNNIIDNVEGISMNSCGGFLIGSYITHNTFSNNNFIRNNNSAYFEYTIPNRCNRWFGNYWDKARLLPKPIIGKIWIFSLLVPWITFDWNPASEPYDIPGSSNFIGCGIK